MSLPDFDPSGDLPAGLHAATLAEVLLRFATGSVQRTLAGERLRRVHGLALATQYMVRFVVFGSFVTSKPEPNDIDVFIVMADSFDVTTLSGDGAIVFQHSEAQLRFGASVFWTREAGAFGGVASMIRQWQICRDGRLRGIIEIVEENDAP